MTSIHIIPVPVFLVFGPVSKSLVFLSNDLDMALVEAKHLWRFGLAHPKTNSVDDLPSADTFCR
jgi:hypothetical protein